MYASRFSAVSLVCGADVDARKDMGRWDSDYLKNSQLKVGDQEVGIPCPCPVVC